MDVYRALGIDPIINAAGTLTVLGCSLMPPEVVDAMAAASRAFVDMHELHLAAGRRLAELIGVEAVHVCDGGAAGIAVMAAACLAGSDPARIARLPDTAGMKRKFIVQQAHRTSFDQAVRVAGGELVEVGADAAAMAAAIDDQTAAIFHTIAWSCTEPALSLPEVVAIAHKAGVPVMVDAAAEVPPLANLTRFLAEGADLVTFSGGKAMRGPQASGLILGRADLVEACRRNSNPHASVGRPMKVGKEEIIGLVRAVELYVSKDHAAEMALWERRVAYVLEAVADLPHVRAWRQFPFGIGQLIPHAAVTWDESAVGISADAVASRLKEGRPRIAVQVFKPKEVGAGLGELRIQPHTLREGEEVIVARRLRECLSEPS